MKRIMLISAAIITTVTIMAFTFNATDHNLFKSSSGANQSYAGDPAGGNLNCTSCHSGTTATMQTGWITSNIPATGYIPNTTYTITATAARSGHSKFGFEISPQNTTGSFLGTLINTSSQTQLTTNTNYITHTSSGTSGSDSKTWTFNWTAPAASSGPVTFYGAFLIANANNNFNGDTTMLSTLTVNESSSTDIAEKKIQTKVSLFPNPFFVQTVIHTNNYLNNATLTVCNLQGQIVKQIRNISGQKIILYRDNLLSGIYFLQITQDNKVIAADKFVITDN